MAAKVGPDAPRGSADLGDGTGTLLVMTLDEGALPVEGVQVALRGIDGSLALTNDAGTVEFKGLEPGSYTIDVSKLGYDTAAQEISVPDGETAEASFTLVQVAVAGASFSRLEILDGYIACGTGTFVVTQVACGLGDSNQKFLHKYQITPNHTALLWEVVWTSTQALSKDLMFNLEKNGCGAGCAPGSTFASVGGCCTLRVAKNGTAMDIPNEKAHTNGAEIQSRMFPAYKSSDGLPTVYTSQSFKIYVEYFEGTPPEGWQTKTNLPT